MREKREFYFLLFCLFIFLLNRSREQRYRKLNNVEIIFLLFVITFSQTCAVFEMDV